jgi:hypothetical protein
MLAGLVIVAGGKRYLIFGNSSSLIGCPNDRTDLDKIILLAH